jgi:hypothetical protein
VGEEEVMSEVKPVATSPAAPSNVYLHLRSLIGSNNAWRTAAEIAKALGCDTHDGRNAIAKAIWTLAQAGQISRRMRAGTGIKECMALVEDARTTARAPTATRMEITTPAAGSVPIRVEPIPAPEPPKLTLGDIVRKHSAARATEPPALDIKAECAAIAERIWPDDEASDDPDRAGEPDVEERVDTVGNELHAIEQLIERAKRPPPVIADLGIKQSVLTTLAGLMPPNVAHYLREIAGDLDRAGA